MDAESQQVEELKAEIERLKEALEALDDHGRASSFMETLKAQKAEIERLKADHAIVRSFLDKADAKLLSHEKLITELCDAMKDWEAAKHWGWTQELIQRARKAMR